MPLYLKRSWNLTGTEEKIFKLLEKIYENEEHESYIYHNVLIGSAKIDVARPMKPDFIIVDPKRGICIIEIKAWKEFSIEGDIAILKNGEKDLNPFVKVQNYFFHLSDILKSKNIEVDKLSVSSHLVFTNLVIPEDYDDKIISIHDKKRLTKLSLKKLFRYEKIIKHNDVERLNKFFNPVGCFSFKNKNGELNICELDKIQEDMVSKNIYGHYKINGIPGSGKSILIASRAIFYKENFPDWRILILAVNSNLINKIEADIKSRLEEKEFLGPAIEYKTLSSFLHKYLPEECVEEFRSLKTYPEKLSFLRDVARPQSEWDAVLIDEYQDFEDDDFRIVKESCRKMTAVINKEEREVENIFLCGDELQQIWNTNNHSWTKIGIDISGRTKILKRSYRSPSDLTVLALEFLKRSGLENEVKKYYEGIEDIEFLNDGEDSCQLDINWDSEGVRLHHSVKSLLDKGISPKDILVIIPPGRSSELLASIFIKEKYRGMIVDSYYKIKGLESQYVFIHNLGSFDYILKNAAKKKAKIIYMCLTRATSSTYITAFKDEGSISVIKSIVENNNSRKKVA